MAKRVTPERLPPPSLLVTREEAGKAIEAQIARGQEIETLAIGSWDELKAARAEKSKWSARNTELLTRLFDNSSIADEYSRFYGGSISMRPVLHEEIADLRSDVRSSITRLESVLGRLDLIPEPRKRDAETTPAGSRGKSRGGRLFLVHGHDLAARESVARFLETLGVDLVILHEQPNAGQTLLEKFEAQADVDFAVVLLTPDDVGASRDERDRLLPRARQNVVFELGFFIGFLGRSRVCALVSGDVERPSDIAGLVYTDMEGEWRIALARELRAAGFAVDMNQVI